MRLILERVNIDLVVFLVVTSGAACAVRFSGRRSLAWIAPMIILLAAFLKLYPLVILFAGCVLVNGGARATQLWLWFALLGALVVCLNAHEIFVIGAKTVQSDTGSFGVTVLGTRIYNHYIGHGQDVPRAFAVAIRAVSTTIFIVLGCYVFQMARQQRAAFSRVRESSSWTGFWMAAAVYVGTFVMGANYSYRLVFILLGIPFLLSVARETVGSPGVWAKATLVIILAVIFSPFDLKSAAYTLVQLFQWSLALLFVAGVVAATPRGLRASKES
jgi:hypothetical protein